MAHFLFRLNPRATVMPKRAKGRGAFTEALASQPMGCGHCYRLPRAGDLRQPIKSFVVPLTHVLA